MPEILVHGDENAGLYAVWLLEAAAFRAARRSRTAPDTAGRQPILADHHAQPEADGAEAGRPASDGADEKRGAGYDRDFDGPDL